MKLLMSTKFADEPNCCVIVHIRKVWKSGLDWINRLLSAHHYTIIDMASQGSLSRTLVQPHAIRVLIPLGKP